MAEHEAVVTIGTKITIPAILCHKNTGNAVDAEEPLPVEMVGGALSTVADIEPHTQAVTVAAALPAAGPTAGRKGIRVTHVSGSGRLFVIARAVGSVEAPSSSNYIVALDLGDGWEEPNFGEDVELAAIAESGSMGVRIEELL